MKFLFPHFGFVLKRLIGFVRFYLGSLVAVFAGFVFPRFDVEFVFLAVLNHGKLRRFAFIELRFGGGDAGVSIRELFGVDSELRANFVQPHIQRLQVEQVL